MSTKTQPTPEQLAKSQQEAEDYLRGKYGAYRGHFAWRELEHAFTTGYLRAKQENEQFMKLAKFGASILEHEYPNDKEQYYWHGLQSGVIDDKWDLLPDIEAAIKELRNE